MEEPEPTLNLLYLIKQLELGTRPLLDDTVSAAGLTPTQYTALRVLERWPGLSSAELARRSFVRPQTVASPMADLLRRDLVTREQDPNSGRQYLLFLTVKGNRVLRKLEDEVEAIERMLLRELTLAQKKALGRYLRACRDALPRR